MSNNFKWMNYRKTLHNEKNCCVVIALALALGITFEESLDLCRGFGRKPRRGVPTSTIIKALDSLGVTYKLDEPERLLVKNFKERGNYILITRNHAMNHQYGDTLDESIKYNSVVNFTIKILEIPTDLKNNLLVKSKY